MRFANVHCLSPLERKKKWMFSICSKVESKQTYLNWKHLWLKELFSMKTSGCTFKPLPNKGKLENLFCATHGHPYICSWPETVFIWGQHSFLGRGVQICECSVISNNAAGVAMEVWTCLLSSRQGTECDR